MWEGIGAGLLGGALGAGLGYAEGETYFNPDHESVHFGTNLRAFYLGLIGKDGDAVNAYKFIGLGSGRSWVPDGSATAPRIWGWDKKIAIKLPLRWEDGTKNIWVRWDSKVFASRDAIVSGLKDFAGYLVRNVGPTIPDRFGTVLMTKLITDAVSTTIPTSPKDLIRTRITRSPLSGEGAVIGGAILGAVERAFNVNGSTVSKYYYNMSAANIVFVYQSYFAPPAIGGPQPVLIYVISERQLGVPIRELKLFKWTIFKKKP